MPGARLLQAGEAAQQGRLAAGVWTDDGGHCAVGQIDRELVENRVMGKADAQVPGGEARLGAHDLEGSFAKLGDQKPHENRRTDHGGEDTGRQLHHWYETGGGVRAEGDQGAHKCRGRENRCAGVKQATCHGPRNKGDKGQWSGDADRKRGKEHANTGDDQPKA